MQIYREHLYKRLMSDVVESRPRFFSSFGYSNYFSRVFVFFFNVLVCSMILNICSLNVSPIKKRNVYWFYFGRLINIRCFSNTDRRVTLLHTVLAEHHRTSGQICVVKKFAYSMPKAYRWSEAFSWHWSTWMLWKRELVQAVQQ